MGSVREYLLIVVVWGLAACGSDSITSEFGSMESLHPEMESLLRRNIHEHPEAISLEEAAALKEPVLPSEADALSLRASSPSDADLLAKFDLYPRLILSSRVIGTRVLSSRDACLEACDKNERCGAVAYANVGGVCISHGPTYVPVDNLLASPVASKNGPVTFDTYLMQSRNQVYFEDGIFFWFAANTLNASAAVPQIKILYKDGTASDWKNLFAMPVLAYSADFSNAYAGELSAPGKEMEGVIVRMESKDRLGMGLFILTRQPYHIGYGGSDNYPQAPWISWSMTDRFELGSNCDADISDGCAEYAGFGLAPTQSPYYSSSFLSLAELQRSTDLLVW